MVIQWTLSPFFYKKGIKCWLHKKFIFILFLNKIETEEERRN